MKEQSGKGRDELVGRVMESYGGEGRISRLQQAFLPSREKIVQLLQELRQLLFPGYFSHELNGDDTAGRLAGIISRIQGDLAEQIYHCLCHDEPESGAAAPCRKRAAALSSKFMTGIPEIRHMLALDAQAAYDGDPAAKSIDEVVYCYPGYYAVTVYRIAHQLLGLGVPLMPRIMTEHAHSVTGCDIHPGATIGRSFFIDHATGVVIGETTVIGENVKMYQGVTLGARSFPKDERGRVIKGLKRHPTIEDNVTIYPNATILGGQTVIGRGVTVGGNSYIMESVAPDSLVKPQAVKLEVLSKRNKDK